MKIKVKSVSKQFKGGVHALHRVDLEVKKGELFGVMGPDGAGKTTLFRILASVMDPSGGSAEVCGYDTVREFRSIRERIGYMPGRFSLYQDLSIEENLSFFASIFRVDWVRNLDLIAPIYRQIAPFKNRRVGALSGGMKQKLALCCALIHQPEVLILDEPGTGVDPVSRKEFWEMLFLLKEKGLTIMVSTPNMDEAALCDRVALMRHGEVVATNTPEGIIAGYPFYLFAVSAREMHRLIVGLRAQSWVRGCFGFGQRAHLSVDNSEIGIPEIYDFLSREGHENMVVESIRPGIEDCYIAIEQGL